MELGLAPTNSQSKSLTVGSALGLKAQSTRAALDTEMATCPAFRRVINEAQGEDNLRHFNSMSQRAEALQ